MNSKPSVNLSATYLGQDKTSSYKPTGCGPRTFFSAHGDVQYVHTLLTNYDTCIEPHRQKRTSYSKCAAAVVKVISGCVCITFSGLMIRSLL